MSNDLIRGASIIGKRHIITAGHCGYATDEGASVYVSAGNPIIGRGKNHRVELIVTHPGLSTTFPYLHDIAIIQTSCESQVSFFQQTLTALTINKIRCFSLNVRVRNEKSIQIRHLHLIVSIKIFLDIVFSLSQRMILVKTKVLLHCQCLKSW